MQFDDIIAEEHRQTKLAKEGTLPEVDAETETSKRNGGASGVISVIKKILKDILTLPTKCAEVNIAPSPLVNALVYVLNVFHLFLQIVIERLKKEGLVYKPLNNDINHEENEVDESEYWTRKKYVPKYFQEVQSTPAGREALSRNSGGSVRIVPTDGEPAHGSGKGTPNDPFIINNNGSPMRSSSSLATNIFPKVNRTPENGGYLLVNNLNNDVSPTGSINSVHNLDEGPKDGKRVRKASRFLSFPYEQMDLPKRIKKCKYYLKASTFFIIHDYN